MATAGPYGLVDDGDGSSTSGEPNVGGGSLEWWPSTGVEGSHVEGVTSRRGGGEGDTSSEEVRGGGGEGGSSGLLLLTPPPLSRTGEKEPLLGRGVRSDGGGDCKKLSLIFPAVSLERCKPEEYAEPKGGLACGYTFVV